MLFRLNIKNRQVKMDAQNFDSNKNKLKELKDLFAEFVNFTNEIIELQVYKPIGSDKNHEPIPNVCNEKPESDCLANAHVITRNWDPNVNKKALDFASTIRANTVTNVDSNDRLQNTIAIQQHRHRESTVSANIVTNVDSNDSLQNTIAIQQHRHRESTVSANIVTKVDFNCSRQNTIAIQQNHHRESKLSANTATKVDSSCSLQTTIVIPNDIVASIESETSASNTIVLPIKSNAITRFDDGLNGTESFRSDERDSGHFSIGECDDSSILPIKSNATTRFDDVVHDADYSCSNVHIDMEIDWSITPASENSNEITSTETYPRMVEITDVANWDNFRKISVGKETFYTDGVHTYEPAIDVTDWDSDNLIEIIIDDTETMLQNDEFVLEGDKGLEVVVTDETEPVNYGDGELHFGLKGKNDKRVLKIASSNPSTETVVESEHLTLVNQIVEPLKHSDLALPNPECGFKIVRQQGCDKSKMFVPTSNTKTKKLCCMYCLQRYRKLERHLRLIHKNETDVKHFVALPLRSKSRRDAIASIRKKGEFLWNSDLTLNRGEFQTSRFLDKRFQIQPWQRIACASCFGSYSSKTLHNHFRNCSKKIITGERVAQQLGRALEGRVLPNASDELNDLFATIRNSERIRMVQFDWLVVSYGNELCLNYSPYYQEGYIRSKLSAAAKLLELAKNISSDISDFSSLFNVKNCNTVVKAIQNMGKFDSKSKIFGSPGTASTTITLVNTIGELLIVECMKLDDEEKEKKAERFLRVFKRDVKTKVNKLVAVTIAKRRRGKKLNIPTTADIKALTDYVDTERDACYSQLKEKYEYQKWLQLAQHTLVSIMIFNRKRAGETRNLLISDFRNREIIAEMPDMVLETIPEEMRDEIKSGMEIRGKKERDVPTLLKQSWEDCIELMIRYREKAGIPSSNEYIFALPTQTCKVKTVDPWAAINSYAKRCGALNPSSLKGTNLRKHLASYCATQDLSDRDITNLANFMGHDERIHLKIYRQNPLASQVANIAPILNRAQGKIGNLVEHTKTKNAKSERTVNPSDNDSNSDSDSNFDEDSYLESDSSDNDLEEVSKSSNRCIVQNRKNVQRKKVPKPCRIKPNDESGKRVTARRSTKRKSCATITKNKRIKTSKKL